MKIFEVENEILEFSAKNITTNRVINIFSEFSFSGSVLAALVWASTAVQAQAQNKPADESAANEIVVTAQKRQERLMDVPVPVTALSGSDLAAQNQTKAQEFYASIPGVNLQFQNNRAQLAIRGITTSPVTGNPVVGFTIDDVPYGSSTGQGGLFGAAPDLDPSDLARIEVLRGPQGTLYGASSMGGLVKYVTIDPDLSGFGGSIGGGVLMIHHGGQTLGHNVHGAVNVPLGETVAVRASAFTRWDPGYIDNVRTGKDGVNASRVSGGHLSMLWKPAASFSLKLEGLYQMRDIDGSANVDSQLGSPYLQTDQIGTGRSRSVNQMYSALIKVDLSGVDLTSLTAFSRNTNYDYLDFTASPLTDFLFPAVYLGVTDFGNVLLQGYDVDKVSHETRLSGRLGSNVDWILGGFYTHEKAKYKIDSHATNPADGSVYGDAIVWRDDLTYDEYAAFGNVTVKLSQQFDVQFGARYSKNNQNMTHREWDQYDPLPAAPYHSVTNPKASGNSFTFQVVPRFRPSPDLSLFYIDWSHIQITQVSSLGTFTYNSNAGMARSQGFEVSFEARPIEGLSLNAWWSYVDATLRESFASDAVYAAKGDRLPYSSKNSARFSFRYEAPVAHNAVTASFGASATYVGERKGEFVPTAQEGPLRQSYPGYVQFDANAGMAFGDWKLEIFVQNLTNRHGVIGGGYYNQTSFNQHWFNYAQPRTIGLNVNYKF
ncbi:MAG: TonB-dependent receptor [Novosphingobium sp.]